MIDKNGMKIQLLDEVWVNCAHNNCGGECGFWGTVSEFSENEVKVWYDNLLGSKNYTWVPKECIEHESHS